MREAGVLDSNFPADEEVISAEHSALANEYCTQLFDNWEMSAIYTGRTCRYNATAAS